MNAPGSGRRSHQIGRGEKVRRVVLAATLEELAAVGYTALTIENVAQRAGVHKTTVYRRWGDREQLVVDAVSDHVRTEVPVPDTGAIDGDLRALARGLVQWVQSPIGQAIITTMVSGAGQAPEIAQARSDFYRNRFGQASIVIERAVERGEIPGGTEPAGVLKALAAMIFFRVLVLPEPLDESLADQTARITLAAAASGAFVRADSAG